MSALAAAPRAPDPAAPTAGRQAFRRLETWLYSAPSKRLGLPASYCACSCKRISMVVAAGMSASPFA